MPDNQQPNSPKTFEIRQKSREELENMTAEEINRYIIDITQTPICNDSKYCDMVLKIYLKK